MNEPLISVEQLIADFKESKGWDKQYRLLIQLGKKLPVLSEQQRTVENQIKGCASVAWLAIEKQDRYYNLKMDSDARVVKGLMMILMIIFQGKSAPQIAAVDVNAIFTQLGLINHLSPSRANGFLAIVEKIKGVGAFEKN